MAFSSECVSIVDAQVIQYQWVFTTAVILLDRGIANTSRKDTSFKAKGMLLRKETGTESLRYQKGDD